jgi:N-(5-amino-5-carboxypentanoyl)-L-cysteinyl-D-valine synthase
MIVSPVSIQTDDWVGLLLNEEIDMVTSIMAVWKTGAAYVPLYPTYTAEPVALILRESSAKILLTTRGNMPKTDELYEIPP